MEEDLVAFEVNLPWVPASKVVEYRYWLECYRARCGGWPRCWTGTSLTAEETQRKPMKRWRFTSNSWLSGTHCARRLDAP
jgi:hypothetical protein